MNSFLTGSRELEGDPIEIYGSGKRTRSFCYISDLLEGLYKLMNLDNFTGLVSLGNLAEKTIRDFASKIIETTNSSSQIEFKPLPEDDPKKGSRISPSQKSI